MKKKFFVSVISLVLCVCVAFSGTFSLTASSLNLAEMMAGLLSGNSGVNISQVFSEWLKGQVDSKEKESVIDKLVSNLKNKFLGTEPEDPGVDPSEDPDNYVTLNEGEAANIAELFNLTVNELKNGNPAFTKRQIASMDAKIASSLQGGLGPVTGIVESLIGTKDIFAGVIDGTNGKNEIRTSYPSGNDVINNIPVSGKNYVANLTKDDIKDYTITIFRSGAYRMHIDLIDAEGSAAASGLSHVFDTTDKAYATLNLGTSALNISVMLRYVHNYVECEVNRNGEITRYTMNMGITFLFPQEDGTYSPEMPYLGVDFEKEGIIYNITTEFSGIDFSLRKMGDANNDGKVNSTDARLVLRMASGLETCPDDAFPYCDVTLDKQISAGDARAILRASSRASTLPTTTEALGYKEYQKSASVQKHVDDLLVLIMAYQAAKDEAERKKLQESYQDKYNGSSTAPEEPTTGKMQSTGDKVNDALGQIGGILGDLFGK